MCEIYSIINAQFIFQGLKYLIFNSIQKQNDIKYFLLLTTLFFNFGRGEGYFIYNFISFIGCNMECLWITTALESDINNWGLGLSRTDKVLTAHVCFHKPAQSQSRRCLTFLNITNLVVFALFYTKSTLKNSDKYSLTFSIPIDSKMFFCFIF